MLDDDDFYGSNYFTTLARTYMARPYAVKTSMSKFPFFQMDQNYARELLKQGVAIEEQAMPECIDQQQHANRVKDIVKMGVGRILGNR